MMKVTNNLVMRNGVIGKKPRLRFPKQKQDAIF